MQCNAMQCMCVHIYIYIYAHADYDCQQSTLSAYASAYVFVDLCILPCSLAHMSTLPAEDPAYILT